MTYIILAAGKGTNLHPLTLKTPKSLYKLDHDLTVIQKMVKSIKTYDNNAEIVIVSGFMHEYISAVAKKENVIVVRNPFYAVTGSIASLWFAKKYLERNNVTVLNADIVCENKLWEDIVCKETNIPFVLIDSSKRLGKYNVQVQNDRVLVMSQALSSFYGQYASVTKLDAVSSRFLKKELDDMINDEMYDQLYENALVQMIFENSFCLYFRDIANYSWAEVDTVDDLIKAKEVLKDN